MSPNLQNLRSSIPLLKKTNLVYLDSACSSLKPAPVIEAIVDYYQNFPACANRSIHSLGLKVTKEVEIARKNIANFIGAKQNEIIFTKNTTDSINLVAHSLDFKPNDIILTNDKEHNSNFLPWQNHKIAQHKIISTKNGHINIPELEQILKTHKIKLLSISLTSHLDGITIEASKIIKLAHKYNTLVLLDSAQTLLHKKINVKSLGADFLAFSSQKIMGPTGLGVLFVKDIKTLTPTNFGGGVVNDDQTIINGPSAFEAGTQNYASLIGFSRAIDAINKIPKEEIETNLKELSTHLLQNLKTIKDLIIINESPKPTSIISFYIKNKNSESIAIKLDIKYNIAVRSGHFCTHYYFKQNKINSALRISLAPYNNKKDIEKLIKALTKICL
ncbi:MAG: hypothetical protein COV57_01605 [Candidatus Liptonbacteria bacterium CG11_big_fil_rev_8_21_14_0_20_35_14]|uniref:cysteine desulfurase n=1 Tax=Candidatus Liptonbacteria bacterium CG11_big_fil_rev_8_21_14_0_20_35_14 TaxID=1974634 RepID=A0A2H0N7V0_9BACT|nr:MAG: hypothetical protein COV57_01605 [Candidatus Liptonbacteria bacterium CG11_big_fil_rev_8_21_14_0_20_35_14]